MKTTRIRPETVQEQVFRELQKSIGINWRRIRNEHGISLYEMCRASGISYSIACDIESCRQESTSIEDCRKAAEYYGMTFDEFVGELISRTSAEDPVPCKDITRADIHDVFPYNLVMMVTGEVPDPADVNIKGVAEAIASLTDREQRVILSRYKYNKSLDQTGKTLGIPREQAGSIESKALRKLRHTGWREVMKVYSIGDFVSSQVPADAVEEQEIPRASVPVSILYSEIKSEFKYPEEEILPEDYARKAIARATALVFSNFILLRNQRPEDYARNRQAMVEENRARINIINLVCDANYIGAYYAMQQWLDSKPDADYLSYDEAQYLSILHTVLEGSMRFNADQTQEEQSETVIVGPRPVFGEERKGTDIRLMGLSNRAMNVLKRLECTTSEDINNIGRKELSKVRGCGAKVLEELTAKMSELGYEWSK